MFLHSKMAKKYAKISCEYQASGILLLEDEEEEEEEDDYGYDGSDDNNGNDNVL